MAENNPNLVKDINLQIEESEQTSDYTQRNPPIIIKFMKTKDEEKMKMIKGKGSIAFKGIVIQLTTCFLSGTIETRSNWRNIFEGLKKRIVNPEFCA